MMKRVVQDGTYAKMHYRIVQNGIVPHPLSIDVLYYTDRWFPQLNALKNIRGDTSSALIESMVNGPR